MHELEELQWKKLRALLYHSYENVPFYHQKFRQAGIKPDDIRGINDLSKLPITTKSELQKMPIESVTARNIDSRKCQKTRTSGSTGTPLNLILDKPTIDCSTILWFRTYQRNGLHFWDRMAVIRDPAFFPPKRWFQRFGVMRRKCISALDDAERQIILLKEYRPDAIKSYSSSLKEIARIMNAQSRTIRPRLIFTGASLLSNWARNQIHSAFHVDPLDCYGTQEFSLIAWECTEHSGYHVNADCLLTEILHDGERVASGEKGELICTGLTNYAMPLIRYRLDDIATPIDDECPCGVKLPLLKNVEGRENDFLIALDGRRIPPARFFPFPFDDYAGITQMRINQYRKNGIKIELVAEDTFDRKRLEKARSKIQEVFGQGMQIEFEMVESLERDATGKMRNIIRSF
jgi:phenylacetate-CoA ligase